MDTEYSKLADGQDARKEFLAKLPSEVTRINTSFRLPEGVHQLLVADKDAFGVLIIESKRLQKKFALNIVAGTVTTNEGIVHTIENSNKPGVKTLAFPDVIFFEMACNGDYNITVNEKGYVIAVNAVDYEAVPASQVRTPSNKEKKLAF